MNWIMVVISQLYHKHTFSETRWRQKIRLHQKHPVRGINIWSKPFSMLQRRIGPKRSEAEIRTYEQELNRGYECQFFALPSPIAVSGDLKRIINVSVGAMNFRIYPPFALNEKKHASGSFVEVAIPEGVEHVENTTTIPSDAVTGVRAGHGILPNGIWARGLRIDVPTENSTNTDVVIGELLDHVCQCTHQWWVRGTHDPFLGFVRLGAAVGKDFRTRQLFRSQGAAKVEPPWYGAARFQPALGAAAILDETTWTLIGHHLSQGNRADVGILGIHDAVASIPHGEWPKLMMMTLNRTTD